ncbi:MAG TPA: DMT family transporter [Burkholderiales bacterium]|nr:DMT family transporter [Burkholderiales bacterium]
MRPPDVLRLVTLAALWGGSFLFLRIAAPVLGPLFVAELRLAVAATTLLAWAWMTGAQVRFAGRWRAYLVVGTVNSAVPFALFAYAAVHLPASYSAVLNATSPLFGALFAALWLNERLTLRRVSGLVAGMAGVALLVGFGPVAADAKVVLAALAAIGAACCYALAVVYTRLKTASIEPFAVAVGSQVGAALVLSPALAPWPSVELFTAGVVASVLALAVACTAFAYVLYFRLIANVGAARALTVTFLIPVFGVLWGVLFLGEPLSLFMLAGGVLVIGATWLVVGET